MKDVVFKLFLIGATVLVASVQAEGPWVVIPDHPQCYDPNGLLPVYFPHPTNCSRFYECRQKDAYEMECPVGLHFNKWLNVCDYPEAAKCVEGEPGVTTAVPALTTTAAPTPPPQPPVSTTTERPSPTNPPPVSTTTTTAAPTTPTPTFPPTTPTTWTDPATTADETTGPWTDPTTTTTYRPSTWTTPTTRPSATPPGSTDPHCPPSGAAWPNYWAHDVVCSKYLACWEGCVQEFTCPSGTYWDNALQACVYSNAHCPCPAIPPAPVLVPSTTMPW